MRGRGSACSRRGNATGTPARGRAPVPSARCSSANVSLLSVSAHSRRSWDLGSAMERTGWERMTRPMTAEWTRRPQTDARARSYEHAAGGSRNLLVARTNSHHTIPAPQARGASACTEYRWAGRPEVSTRDGHVYLPRVPTQKPKIPRGSSTSIIYPVRAFPHPLPPHHHHRPWPGAPFVQGGRLNTLTTTGAGVYPETRAPDHHMRWQRWQRYYGMSTHAHPATRDFPSVGEQIDDFEVRPPRKCWLVLAPCAC